MATICTNRKERKHGTQLTKTFKCIQHKLIRTVKNILEIYNCRKEMIRKNLFVVYTYH